MPYAVRSTVVSTACCRDSPAQATSETLVTWVIGQMPGSKRQNNRQVRKIMTGGQHFITHYLGIIHKLAMQQGMQKSMQQSMQQSMEHSHMQ